MSRLLAFAYLLEAGLLLLVVPWSAFWERNFFIEHVPIVEGALTNLFVRGAISGVGVVCLWAALAELATLLAERRARGDETLTAGSRTTGVHHQDAG